jgi:gliding motility-associated-like protein
MKISHKLALHHTVLPDLPKLKIGAICTLLLCMSCCVLNAQTIMTAAGSGTIGYTGDGMPASTASIDKPHGVAIDNARNIFIADYGNKRLRKVNTSGIITTVAGNGLSGGPRGDGGPATDAQFFIIEDVAVNKATGEIYICDYGDRRIRKVNSSGMITTIAGNDAPGFPSGDGGPATAATFGQPGSVAVDLSGNVYIGDLTNFSIRKINTAGIISTYAGTGSLGHSGDGGPATAAQLGSPSAIEVDGAGNLYIADSFNHVVRKISASGIIATIAGTPGTPGSAGDGGLAISAQLHSPRGITIDAMGNIFIADAGNAAIRKIDATGKITTYAGTTIVGFSGDGSPATAAQLSSPTQMDVDIYGDLYIADLSNNRIRKIFEVVTITISPNDTVCPGTNVTLTATADAGCGIATYQWYKNGIASGSGASTYTYIPANGDEVYCTVTTSGGTCTPGINASSNTITIWVQPWITTTGTATACVGQTTAFTGSPSGGTWSTGNAGIATVTSAGIVTGIAAGTTEISYSLGAACYTSSTVSVGLTPNAGIIAGAASVCVGQSITLTDTITGGTWSCSTGATIGTTGIMTGVTPGIAIVTYTVSNALCTATATTNITVFPSSEAGTITAPAILCPGGSFVLTSTAGGGTWSSSNTIVATVGSTSGNISAVSIGTTTISYTVGANASGCSATATIVVAVVLNGFALTESITNPLCYGDSTGSISLATNPANVTYTYSWGHGDTSAIVSGLPAGSYSVLVTQPSSQCKQSRQFEITTPDSLTASIYSYPKVCEKGGVLSAQVTGGTPAYQYLWTGDSATYTSFQATYLEPGVYTLTATDANGCKREWPSRVNFTPCIPVLPSGGFSPNGDGINDVWSIYGLDEYPLNMVEVFDKWGDFVYKKSHYENDWNGTKSGGGPLPDGTYYYLIKLNEPYKPGGDNIFKGRVIIKR